ncbi:MAG: hypothetical protein H6573_28610 [Lewinellaceae bacterium]|nr:hypothetical protein [Lewinellaceae bacterium]
MPLGATHYTSSALLVFFRPDGLHGLNDLAVEILDPVLEFFFRAKHKFDKEAFEQSGSNVPVGLVVVLPLFVYFFDLTLFCREKGGLDIVIDEVRINVPEQIGAGSASNY